MGNVTLWKDKWVCHCPKCDNIWGLVWMDGEDVLGKGMYKCPECLHVFVPTAKMFLTEEHDHGTFIPGNAWRDKESANAKARRKARE